MKNRTLIMAALAAFAVAPQIEAAAFQSTVIVGEIRTTIKKVPSAKVQQKDYSSWQNPLGKAMRVLAGVRYADDLPTAQIDVPPGDQVDNFTDEVFVNDLPTEVVWFNDSVTNEVMPNEVYFSHDGGVTLIGGRNLMIPAVNDLMNGMVLRVQAPSGSICPWTGLFIRIFHTDGSQTVVPLSDLVADGTTVPPGFMAVAEMTLTGLDFTTGDIYVIFGTITPHADSGVLSAGFGCRMLGLLP